MVVTIPLNPIPNQSVALTLNNQPCQLTIRTLSEADQRQYLSLSLAGTVICQNVLMVNDHELVMADYTGFIGDFAVIDTQGDAPPLYTGWGTRWQLVYSDAG